MKQITILLTLVLFIDCQAPSAPVLNQTATLELYGTFHSIGLTITIAETDDPNENATALVEYRQGNEPYQPGFPLTRINATRFIGSLFWLTPNTTYDVRVTFTDPNGDSLNGISLANSIATRAEITIPSPNNSFIVSPTGSGTTCSLPSPCALAEGIERAQPGDELLLRGGVYYEGEISLPRSGTPGKPIVIRSYPNEVALFDGADSTPLSWTPIGGGLYRSTHVSDELHLVVADGVRLYPYPDLTSLQTLSWDLPGFYTDGQQLYVHLADGRDPNTTPIAIARYRRGFNVNVDYIYFLNLAFRHYGQESETRAIYLNNASNNLIQGSTFALNNGAIAVKGDSDRNVIQDNEFYDTIFAWPWDAVKAASYLERGGIFFGNPAGGRGNVIRRNRFHDFFDGFDACSSEFSNETDETDIYDNLIYNIGDDGLQIDGWCHNIRIWNNTFRDVLVGISFAPTVGGPIYALRNTIYQFGVGNNDHEGRSFKFNSNRDNQSGPIYLMHNTIDAVTPDTLGIKLSGGSSPGWDLIYSRNNSWSGTTYALRNIDVHHPIDFDHDNLWSSENSDLVRWDGTVYATLAEFTAATGQESHGFNVNPDFQSPQTGDYGLRLTSDLIDKGVLIPGINHHYLGAAPDIGAVESTANAAAQIYLPFITQQ